MVPNHMGIDSRWVIEHPEWFISLAGAPLPRLHVRRREPGRGRAGRDPARGPLLGQQRRGRRVRAARPLVRRAALHLPRQRRHELPVERHRPARLQPGRRPGAGDPDDRRRRAAVPGHPLRRRDGARPQARPAAVVPGPRRGRRRDPVAGRVRDDDARPTSMPRCPPSSGARSSTGSRSRPPTPSCWPRRSGCSRATSSGPWACTASTTARSCTCSATRTTRATGGCSRRPSSSTPRSSSATSTS